MFSILMTLAAWGGAVERFESRNVERLQDKRIVAMTTASNGASFGQVCRNGESCDWTLVAGSCNAGDRFPALATSSTTAITLELECEQPFGAGMAQFSFSRPEHLEAVLRNAPRFGIALPLQADQIRVLGFDLTGSTAAIERAKARNAAR